MLKDLLQLSKIVQQCRVRWITDNGSRNKGISQQNLNEIWTNAIHNAGDIFQMKAFLIKCCKDKYAELNKA